MASSSRDDGDARKVYEEDDYINMLTREIEDGSNRMKHYVQVGEGSSGGTKIHNPNEDGLYNQWQPSVLYNEHGSMQNDGVMATETIPMIYEQNYQSISTLNDVMTNPYYTQYAQTVRMSNDQNFPVVQQTSNQNIGIGSSERNEGMNQSDSQFRPLQDWLMSRERERKVELGASDIMNRSTGRRSVGEKSNNVSPKPEDHIVDHVTIPYSYIDRTAMANTILPIDDFSFKEVGRLHSMTSKVLCCHFASSGSYLASGHDKKVFIYNLRSFQLTNTSEEHTDLISDVRFRPNSSIFATSSLDGTVKTWDATRAGQSAFTYKHPMPVTSIDFHPCRTAMICSSDITGGIRLWNGADPFCNHVLKIKGDIQQIRFQPRTGELLAAIEGNRINLIDVEQGISRLYLEGHDKDVRFTSWDIAGKYIVSVSEDSAEVWSLTTRRCAHVLQSKETNPSGNVTKESDFHSCIFHPGCAGMVIIGCDKGLQVWNPVVRRTLKNYQAHDGIVATLAESQSNELVASASHDQWVKLWK